MLYEQMKQEFQTMTEEDLENFLSPLQILIKNLSKRIKEQESFFDADEIKKEAYNKELYIAEVCSITEKLDTFGQNITTLKGAISYFQKDGIESIYQSATDINDFLRKLELLLSWLKNKEVLKEKISLFTHS